MSLGVSFEVLRAHARPRIYLFVSLSICLSLLLSVCLSISVSLCLQIKMSLSVTFPAPWQPATMLCHDDSGLSL